MAQHHTDPSAFLYEPKERRKRESDLTRMVGLRRVLWAVLGLVIVAALLGLLGTGPLSRSTAEAGALSLAYERFARASNPTELRLTVTQAPGETVAVAFSRAYLDRVQVEKITPEPVQAATGADALTFDFAIGGPGTIVFRVKPAKAGNLDGWVGLAGGERVEFGQFVYP